MAPTEVTSEEHFRSLTASSTSYALVDFHASWCGPCHAIAPLVATIANSPEVTRAGLKVLKVDVDKVQSLAARYSVRAMPTFLVLKGTDKIDELTGANPAGLRALVQRHLPAAAAAAASAPGPSTGEGSSSTSAAPAGMISLLAEVVSAQATCLNELSTGKASGLGALLSRSKDAKLESDADAQLLLQLPLRSALRIRSVRLRTAAATDDADDGAKRAPRTIKLFVNRPALGFEDAESDEPAQEIELTEKQATKGGNVELRFVRFQNVSHLSIFVVDNQGDEDSTRIDELDLFGPRPDSATGDLAQLKQQHEDD